MLPQKVSHFKVSFQSHILKSPDRFPFHSGENREVGDRMELREDPENLIRRCSRRTEAEHSGMRGPGSTEEST